MTALIVVASALGAYLVGALVRFAVNALDRTLATETIRVYSDSADQGYRYAIIAIEAEVALHKQACRRQRRALLWGIDLVRWLRGAEWPPRTPKVQ